MPALVKQVVSLQAAKVGIIQVLSVTPIIMEAQADQVLQQEEEAVVVLLDMQATVVQDQTVTALDKQVMDLVEVEVVLVLLSQITILHLVEVELAIKAKDQMVLEERFIMTVAEVLAEKTDKTV